MFRNIDDESGGLIDEKAYGERKLKFPPEELIAMVKDPTILHGALVHLSALAFRPAGAIDVPYEEAADVPSPEAEK